jgi:transcriptional regulator with XRE-family HTH domain
MSTRDLILAGRKRLKLSQQAFANKCGVSRAAVQQWEQKDGTAPSRAHQPAVAKALGISIAELMGGSEPRRPHGNFADRHEVSESDWALLQDIKSAAFESEIEAIRQRARELQRRVDQRIAELKGKL